jgi:muconolactone delta-isomerase
MKILAIERDDPNIPSSRFTEPLLKEEAQRAWELQQSGLLRELYFRVDEEAAVLMLECEDIAHAKAILSTLPLVREKLIDFEIIPLKAYPGIERLFARQS